MKKVNLSRFGLSSLILFVITIFSCNQNTGSKSEGKNQKETIESKNCYLYAFKTDSIFLSIIQGKDSITGVLDYIPYEKDACLGTLSGGYYRGDTLYAMYNSTQEGQTSDCEMAILKKGNNYILTNDIGGDNYTFNADYTKGSFKNKSKIKFTGEELKPFDCK
jgi:hypothetical protein